MTWGPYRKPLRRAPSSGAYARRSLVVPVSRGIVPGRSGPGIGAGDVDQFGPCRRDASTVVSAPDAPRRGVSEPIPPSETRLPCRRTELTPVARTVHHGTMAPGTTASGPLQDRSLHQNRAGRPTASYASPRHLGSSVPATGRWTDATWPCTTTTVSVHRRLRPASLHASKSRASVQAQVPEGSLPRVTGGPQQRVPEGYLGVGR